MKRIVSTVAGMVSVCLALVGCKTDSGSSPNSAKSTNTYAVVVGMEKSLFAGECPGAAYDSERMFRLVSRYAADVTYLKDGEATKERVSAALRRAIELANNGLVIFYYSGHGGSEPFPNVGIEETDGKDEFLCLYDTWLRDNEIWTILSQSRGRVFMCIDACHSQTMWRHPGFKLILPLAWDHNINEDASFSLLCWSGCPDNAYSYGSPSGGQFTNAILRHYTSGKTYEALWSEVKADKVLKAYENVQSTAIGIGFDGKAIFR